MVTTSGFIHCVYFEITLQYIVYILVIFHFHHIFEVIAVTRSLVMHVSLPTSTVTNDLIMSSFLKNPLHPSIFPLPRSEWSPDDKHKECMSCLVKFSGGVFRTGKHHCRKCGHVVCKKCCKLRIRKQMVCKQCYAQFHQYEFVFTPTMMVSNAQSMANEEHNHHTMTTESESDTDDDDDDDVDSSDEPSHSLLIFNESPRRHVPVIALDLDTKSDTPSIHKSNEEEHDTPVAINRVEEEDADTYKSYSADYVPFNLEGDIIENTNTMRMDQCEQCTNEALQNSIGMLKLYIEQLAIYTQRVRGLSDSEKLKQMKWTADDVWNAIKQRQKDEERFVNEFGIKCVKENNDKKDEEHADVDDMMMETELGIGFEDIYESIVAYEYDIKSLCDMILIEIALNHELDSYKSNNRNLNNELKHLHSQYNDVIADLHHKEHLLHLAQEKENEFVSILNEYDMKKAVVMKRPPPPPPPPKAIEKAQQIMETAPAEKEHENISILTLEKCILFREEIGAMKKWIKQSKQNMRKLKTEFAENHQFLELKFNKFWEIWDEFSYEREVLYQKRQKLDEYIEQSAHQINAKEHVMKRKEFEMEEVKRRLEEKEIELNERLSCFEKEKRTFDAMNRKYNEEKIENELKNAQLLSAKMLKMEEKERKVLSEMDSLEITAQYLSKQKALYLREREVLHQQEQVMFANKKSLAKQKDLISTDQTYIQQEYIDAKDRMENERYVLKDKINVLTTQTQTQSLHIQSLTNQIEAKQHTTNKLQQDLYKMQSEMNQIKSIQFHQSQQIKNLKQELQRKNDKIGKVEQSLHANHERNLQQINQMQAFSAQKLSFQNANTALLQQIEQLKDQIKILKVKKSKAKSKSKKSKKKKTTSK
eukprot:936175_1